MANTLIESKAVVVEGVTYEITMLGALTGRKLWLKLIQAIADPLRAIASASSSGDKPESAMIGALATAVESLDETTLEQFYTAFAAKTLVVQGERKPSLDKIFDIHFAGRYTAMSQWLFECIRFNFASFLGDIALGDLLEKGRAAVQAQTSASPSPKISTGSSTES